jgi:heat shock protein HtpX
MLANFGLFFGGGRDRPNILVTLALMFIMPMAATVIQMTVSRNREFMADAGAAEMTGHPEWLQSGLAKLDNYARGISMPEAAPQTAHMIIISPFTGRDESLKQLFSTNPSTEQRIERLEALKR